MGLIGGGMEAAFYLKITQLKQIQRDILNVI